MRKPRVARVKKVTMMRKTIKMNKRRKKDKTLVIKSSNRKLILTL